MKPIAKYWKLTVQKVPMQKTRRVGTTSECIERKIRMVEIQLKAAFEKESKLFLSEFQKPDCFKSGECTAYVSAVMKRHLDVLFANCLKNYIHLCTLNYFSSLTQHTISRRQELESHWPHYWTMKNCGRVSLKMLRR